GRGWPRGVQAGVSVLGATCFVLLAMGLGGAAVRHPLGKPALQLLRAIGDNDADGFADWLGGGDCDDGDPTSNPLALEVVGNGRDDNCHAGDLQSAGILPASQPKAGTHRPDVVLLSIDALRADVLTPEYMPNLWRFAQRSRRYTQAYSAASFTDLSLRSLFTGWPASDFDITGVLTGMDRPLADLMSEAGWQTFALHPLPHLGELVLLGFQRVNDDPSARHRTPNGTSAPQVTALALDLLQQPSTTPRLLWTHYYEPHHRYLRHAGFERFGDSSRGRYHQEVAFVDQQLAPLLEWLARPEVAEHTVVILFADHGEYLGERGGRSGHDLTLFQPVLRVPLLVSAPDVPAATIDTPVSLLDVFPTVLNLAGISGVEPRAGFDLLHPPAHRVLLAEARDSRGGAPSIALRAEGKLLYCVESSNHCELCDERMDPECRHPDVSPGRLTREPLYLEMSLLLDSYRNDARHRARKEAFGARWSSDAAR
ncbi:MAG TPA: sulfatase, partial [Polyangiaceae bacterium]|nr:sulfatase [Polyangiaceae bacterium]